MVPDSRVQWEAICPQTLLAGLDIKRSEVSVSSRKKPSAITNSTERGVLDFLVTPQNSELRSG